MKKLNQNLSLLSIAPDLRQIQLDNFQRFLSSILPAQLANFSNRVYHYLNFEVKLQGNGYRFEVPQESENFIVYKMTTYSFNIYIPLYLYNIQNYEFDIQTICLGKIPLMTENGSFIINGIYRCMITQLIRSPGIYFTLNSSKFYTATIISNNGKRFKLQIDSYGAIWIILNNSILVPFPVLLLAFGLKQDKVPFIFRHWIFSNLKGQDEIPSSVEEASIYILSIIRPELFSADSLKRPDLFNWSKTFLSFFLSEYELGIIGRLNVNTRLSIKTSENAIHLCVEDLIYAGFQLIDLWKGGKSFDDIDDLKHKKVKGAGDLIYEQIKTSLDIVGNKIQSGLKKIRSKKRQLNYSIHFLHVSPFNVEVFMASFELSQFIDQTNPLAEIIHKRKLSALGPGGLTPRTARFKVRDIHPSQYGRICPIETAEGQNAGIVTSFSMSAEIDKLGRIQSIFYNIYDNAMKGNVEYLNAHDDENLRVGTGYFCLPSNDNASKNLTPVQNRREFLTVSWHEVNYRIILPLHYFSIGVALIPFLEHDDSTRALMGSNMQRQAVRLSKSEKPIVGTGIEALVAMDSGTIITAHQDAFVEDVNHNKIVLRSVESNDILRIYLSKNGILNNNHFVYQKARVQKGTYVRQGQLIADSNATVGGELALGKNILVAYMPWQGYNFEDAILINERLVKENILTSMKIQRYVTEFKTNDQSSETLTNKIVSIPQFFLRNLDQRGLVKIGKMVQAGDVLVGKIIIHKFKEINPLTRLLRHLFEMNPKKGKSPKEEEDCLKLPVGGDGLVVDVRCFNYEDPLIGSIQIVHVYVLETRPIKIGDKLAGRHGNKGVVSHVLSMQEMPYLQDGTPIDMILSPLGVPSRMNVGQVFECLLGLAGFYLQKNYRILPFDERYEKEASRKLVFSELYKSSQITNHPWLFEAIHPGKIRLFDGRSGQMFDQAVTVGKAYMLKLIHQVDEKIHSRSTGPYAIITQQPLRGKSRKGGQRVGEMEVWAFQGFGAAYALQELLTTKSDHIEARSAVINSIISGQPPETTSTPADCLRGLVRELRSLGINIKQNSLSKDNGMSYPSEL